MVSGTDQKVRKGDLKLSTAPEQKKLCDQVSISDTGPYECEERQLEASTYTQESPTSDSRAIHNRVMFGTAKIHNKKTKVTTVGGKLKEELSLKGDNSTDEIEASPSGKSNNGNVDLDFETAQQGQDLSVSFYTSLRHSKKCFQREFPVIC